MTTPGFTVGELVATTLDALINAAAAHLGQPLPDGRQLAKPDARQAYMALLCAGELLESLSPLMNEAAVLPIRAGLARQSLIFAELHPDFDAVTMAPPVTSIGPMVEALMAEFGD